MAGFTSVRKVALDDGLFVALLAWSGWSAALGWYIETDRWLPKSMRSHWKQLHWSYGVRRKPHDVSINHVGCAILGRMGTEIVVFYADVGVSKKGLYINLRHLGRLWIRWEQPVTFSRATVPTPDGWMPALALLAPDIEGVLVFQWDRQLDDVPPPHVAFYESQDSIRQR